MAFTTQRLSVAVQYSAAQEVAEALGLSVAADPRAPPIWEHRIWVILAHPAVPSRPPMTEH